MRTWYAHLKNMFSDVGDNVKGGEQIGEVGNTGNSTGPHLHFTVQHSKDGLDGFIIPNVVDPEKYLIDLKAGNTRTNDDLMSVFGVDGHLS